MATLRTITKRSGVGLASVALVAAGLVAASASVAAEDGPIEPADAPEIMERDWPVYPEDADSHVNIYVGTLILNAELDEEGDPYYDDHPIGAWTPEVEDAVERYQLDKEIGEVGNMNEEFWDYLDALQFDEDVDNPDWGPAEPRWYYDNGDTGAGVRAIQNILISHNYLPINSDDGVYGSQTMGAVEEFQRDHVCDDVVAEAQSGCDDGWVGTVTWRALVTAD